jgi:hypothetical protein
LAGVIDGGGTVLSGETEDAEDTSDAGLTFRSIDLLAQRADVGSGDVSATEQRFRRGRRT